LGPVSPARIVGKSVDPAQFHAESGHCPLPLQLILLLNVYGERKVMKIIVIMFCALACAGARAEVTVGGTLHGSTLRDWHAASAANQLITVADIVEKILNLRDPVAVAPKARAVQSCINRVSGNFKLRSQMVADTAVACMAELGYLPR
jgi:hypothetical protein